MSQELVKQAGIYAIPHDDYHADPCEQPSLSAGIAQLLYERSPRHAWHAHPRLNPDYQNDNDRKFDVGTVAHALLLEGLDHAQCIEADDWRKKDTKAQAEEIRLAGKIPLLTKDYTTVKAMVESAKQAWRDCPDLKGYALEDCATEQTIVWAEDGAKSPIWLRSRPDAMSPDRRLFVDAKFTKTSANPDAFVVQIARMAYDMRGAFYLRGNAATGGAEDAKYVFLVAEAYPPYCAAFIGLDPAYMSLGASKTEAAIEIWADCMDSGNWPGYFPRIHWASPPTWALAQIEAQEIENWKGE